MLLKEFDRLLFGQLVRGNTDAQHLYFIIRNVNWKTVEYPRRPEPCEHQFAYFHLQTNGSW